MTRFRILALLGLSLLLAAGGLAAYLSKQGISVHLVSAPPEGRLVIEGEAAMPAELAAALKEAMRNAENGESGEVNTLELDPASQAAFLRFVEQNAQRASASRLGRRFPVERLQTLDGQPIALSGPRTLVNFWATWCTPCIAEMPLLEALAAEGEYQVITIHNDFDRGDLEDWLESRPLGLPIHYDAGNALASEFGVSSWPTSLVLDAQGVVVRELGGAPAELGLFKQLLSGP